MTAVPQAGCELHVWPGNGLRSVYYGWFHGGIVDGAVSGRQGYPAVPKDPVPTELQVDLLARADLPALLGKTGYAIILHPQVLASRTIRNVRRQDIWTSGPIAPDKWIDIAAAIAQSMAHMKLGVLIAFGYRAFFSSPGFDEWARAMAALTPDAERVVDVISGELAGCRLGDVVPEDKGAASATGASTDRAGQWRDKCALPNLSCFAFLVW